MKNLLEENRRKWELPQSTTTSQFLTFLIEKSELKEVRLAFRARAYIRYAWRDATIQEILMSLDGDPYLSHYTAMSHHNLTEQIPKTIYVNSEQITKPRGAATLEQHRIDLAFKGKGRTSRNFAVFQKQNICLLNGKFTAQLGVIDALGPNREKIRVTNVERTLIDITGRPMYAGGVFEVLKAFKTAKLNDQVSVNKLSATLKKLDYVYPYHQAIGFYMERSGVYDNGSLDILRRFEMKFDFYLDYRMEDKEYSKDWKLFYPKGF